MNKQEVYEIKIRVYTEEDSDQILDSLDELEQCGQFVEGIEARLDIFYIDKIKEKETWVLNDQSV
mgnify:CR=1 FL=1